MMISLNIRYNIKQSLKHRNTQKAKHTEACLHAILLKYICKLKIGWEMNETFHQLDLAALARVLTASSAAMLVAK